MSKADRHPFFIFSSHFRRYLSKLYCIFFQNWVLLIIAMLRVNGLVECSRFLKREKGCKARMIKRKTRIRCLRGLQWLLQTIPKKRLAIKQRLSMSITEQLYRHKHLLNSASIKKRKKSVNNMSKKILDIFVSCNLPECILLCPICIHCTHLEWKMSSQGVSKKRMK